MQQRRAADSGTAGKSPGSVGNALLLCADKHRPYRSPCERACTGAKREEGLVRPIFPGALVEYDA